MANENIFQLIYRELEERSFDNVAQNLKQDSNFQDTDKRETKLFKKYEALNLTKK